MRKETDILMEKHALNKIKEKYPSDEELPSVKLLGTFKDAANLYFVQELLPLKNELWLACRNYGLLSDGETRRTFRLICESVKKLHNIGLVHRDIKVRTSISLVNITTLA
jgi:serine/threonine protein kinase